MIKADDLAIFPIDQWIQDGVRWLALNLRPLFLAIKWPVETLLGFNDYVMHAIPFPAMVLLVAILAWRLATPGIAVFSAASLVIIAVLGVWNEAVTTLSLIATAILCCAAIGIPIGI